MDLLFTIDNVHIKGLEHLETLPWQDTKFCVVTIVGKSQHQSKCSLVNAITESDNALNLSEGWCSVNNLCRIDGYCDAEKQIICLHLQSTFDSSVLTDICRQVENDVTVNDLAGILRTAEFCFAKAMLFTLLVSHVVVLVHPGGSFDISYIRLFRNIDNLRQKIQPVVTDSLKRLTRTNSAVRISKDWISAGRPCSPRMLFVFEGCQMSDSDDDGANPGRSRSQKVPTVTALQHSIEDQIYRILRKARVITNTSNNSLFAIPANQEFVYIQPQHCNTPDLVCYYLEQLRVSCVSGRNKSDSSRNHSYRQSRRVVSASNSVDNDSSTATGKTDSVSSTASQSSADRLPTVSGLLASSDRSPSGFAAFLMPHIELALTRGFDDNVGRNPVSAIFELATLTDWVAVIEQLHAVFWTSSDSRTQNNFSALKSLTDVDVRFSESRCAKVLPVALSTYQEGLPSHYIRTIHLSRLQQAKRVFAMQARGPACERYLTQLEQECERIWRNGHQMCEEISLTGNHCTHELHRLIDVPDMSEETRRLSVKPHSSQFKTRATCNCGRRQGEREDPFDHRSANYDFFERLEQTCCRELKHFEMAVFKPSTTDSRPAVLGASNASVPVVVDAGTERSPKNATIGSRDVLKYEVASSLSLALSLSQNCDLFHERTKQGSFSLEDKDEGNSGHSENGEMAAEVNEADASVDDDRIVVGTCETELQSDLEAATAQRQHSTTEYLPGMVHSNSPPGLLPKFPSWSLVLLSEYSLYNPAQGVDQPGFTHGCNYLLPVDVTVNVESDRLSSYSDTITFMKKVVKHRKGIKELTDVTLRLYVGFEYECSRGHRFFLSSPDRVFKVPPSGIFKETGHRVINHDMPLYFQCTCSRTGKVLVAQLMRVHIGVPDGPVEAKIRPRVQPGPAPCPLFFPESDDIILHPGIWILRLPYVYLGENGPYRIPATDPQSVFMCKFQKNFITVAESSSVSTG